MPYSASNEFTADLMGGLEGLRQRADGLQETMHGIQDAAPERTEGTDQTKTVRVAVGHEGLPESIQVAEHWQDRIRPGALGTAVAEAAQEAARRRSEAWSRTLGRAGSGQRGLAAEEGRAPSPPAMPEPSDPRPLNEIAGDVLGLLGTMLSSRAVSARAQSSQGTGPDRTVAIMLTRSGQLSCTADAQWAARQSGAQVTQALAAALAAARRQLQDQEMDSPFSAERLSRLSAEIQASSSEAQLPAPERGQA